MHAEVERRLVHASGAVFPLAFAFDLITYGQLRHLAVFGSAVTLALEALRLSGAVDWAIFDRLTRAYEQEALAGYALYVLSMTVTVWAFDPPAAIPAMLILALADPVSGLLGSDELRTVKQGRVLAAMFAVSTLIALSFVPPVPALLGGLAAMLADGVKPVVRGHVVDDNLTIAPLAAVAITVGIALA